MIDWLNKTHTGDCRELLVAMAAAGVRAQTCITSPPYFGLRDYGMAGQIGLELTPENYVAEMVAVFAAVREVLTDDGTLWLNLGDSYAAGGNGGGGSYMAERKQFAWEHRANKTGFRAPPPGLKQKDLIGIPWRVALALQADGWYLRSDIIWHKPNPMPESVTDRPTKAHEYLFLLAKSERYYFDAEAIKEPATDTGRVNGRDGRDEAPEARPPGSNPRKLARLDYSTVGRNKRSVWTVATESQPEAHFATFPTALIEPCVLAGARAGAAVLDPFMGSGTTARVAQSLGRQFIGCELNPAYVAIQHKIGVQAGMAL